MESSSEDEGKNLPAQSPDLEFITFTDFDQTKRPETKKRVRSHVMKRVQQNLRRGNRRQREGEIVLDFSLPSQANFGPSQYSGNSMLASAVVQHPYDLGAGRSDPFVKYPIDMDMRTHELFDHLHGDTCPVFKTLNTIGFFRTVADEAGFRQILCTSSAHMTRLRNGTENSEAIAFATEAIRSINKRLSDAKIGISDGVIVTIVAFVCHAVMFNDIQGLLTHFNGLEEIIRQRGGLQALSLNPAIRMVLFWVDVNTAFIHNRSPRFASPDDIIPRINLQPSLSLSGLTLLQACLTDNMAQAIDELLVLNQFIVNELRGRRLWDDGIFDVLNVLPVLSKLLSIRNETADYDPAFARQEACWIGAILYLASVRREFGVNLPTNVYIPKLKDSIIAQDDPNLEKNDPILLWVLLIGGVQSFKHEEHEWFVSATASLVVHKRHSMWQELMAIVGGVLWIDGILESECNDFRREVSGELWTSHRHIFS